MIRGLYCSAVIGMFFLLAGQNTRASETGSLREELADMRAKVASLESARMATAEDEITGEVRSLKARKGALYLGGEFASDLIVTHRDDVTSDSDTVDATEWHQRGNLRFRVVPNTNSYLRVKLDLDDTANDGDLVEELQFVFDQVRGSGWGFVFGKGEVPYGQDKTIGIVQSYHHNDATDTSEGPVFLLAGNEPADAFPSNANPHADVGRTAHPGEVDNVAMIGVNYSYKQLLRFEFAVFQNAEGHEANMGVRMHEDRADDTLLMQSFAARLWIMPFENLETQVSFLKKHQDSANADSGLTGNPWSEDDQYALSLGFDYELANGKLNLFGEYQHGWDWNYTDDYDTNTYQLGLVWNPVTPVKIGLMGEWLDIDDDHNGAEEDYARVVVNGKYTFPHGIYLMLEYAHEWWDGDFRNAADQEREGDLIAFRMGWTF